MLHKKISVASEYIIITLIAFFCYGFSLQGHFVFDDYEAIVNNDDVRLDSNIFNLFNHDFWGGNISSRTSHKSYRPLTVLSFRLNHYISGSLNSFHMKITNFVLYIFVCLLVFIVFKIISKTKDRTAFISTCLFASHPIHSEAVCSIVGRAELLSALFFCLALICFTYSTAHKSFKSVFCCTCSCFCAAFSLMCKENGITIIAVCLVYDLFFEKSVNRAKAFECIDKIKQKAYQYAFLILTMFILLYWRMSIMNFKPPVFQKMDNHISFNDSMIVKSLSQSYLYSLNLWLLLCPVWLCCDWSFECIPLITEYDWRILTIILPWIFIGSIIYFGNMHVRLGLMFMIVSFLPASGIITVGFVIAERVLFLPSIGYCLILGSCIHKASKTFYKTVMLCFVLLILLWIIRSNLRSSEWTNSTKLFESAANVCPNNAKIHYNRALTASVNNNQQNAELMYMEALRLHPEYEQALNNLANLLRDTGRLEEAESYLRRAIQIRPSFGAAWMNLGIVLTHAGSFSEAEKCYIKSLQLRPKHADSHYNLGNLYLNSGRFAEAKKSWQHATTIDPSHLKSWTNLLTLLDSQGKIDEVQNTAKVSMALLPNEPGLHFILANSLGKAGLYDMAEHHFKQALDLKKDPLYYVNLGVLYHRWNKSKEAKIMYTEALKLNPNIKSAKDNYQRLLNDLG